MTGGRSIIIREVTIDPPVIPEHGTATIVVDARSERGFPLAFEVTASEGTIEPTDEINVFLWHGPKSPRRRLGLLKRVVSRAVSALR